MRRHDREITNATEIDAIMRRGTLCHVGLCDDRMPYVVPLNYGYEPGALYVHSAAEGRKIDILLRSPSVCFAVTLDAKVVPGEKPSTWTTHYESVIGWGKAKVLTDEAEKVKGLNILMRQYGGPEGPYEPAALAAVAIARIDIAQITGKRAG